MFSRSSFASSVFVLLIPLLVIGLCTPAIISASPSPLPEGCRVISSSEDQLTLQLTWNTGRFSERAEGVELALVGCQQVGEAGAPMLPLYRGLIALPPGRRASVQWRVSETMAIAGRPVPFPTVKAIPAGVDDHFYHEISLENPVLYLQDAPFSVELGEVRTLRDLQVVELLVRPVSWSPAAGLHLANSIQIDLRFRDDLLRAREDAALVPVMGPDKLWGGLYAGTLLNSAQATTWRRRAPVASLFSRYDRTIAALRLSTEEDGLYGVSGTDLIAAGIATGTSLAEIALFRHDFNWVEDQPEFTENGVSRFFLDAGENGTLDADDTMVFLGRRLRSIEGSVDPIEWFGKAGVYWVAQAPDLVEEMETSDGWEESGSYPIETSFSRLRRVDGEASYWAKPPPRFYIDGNIGPTSETWTNNLYYFKYGRAWPFNETFDLPTPGYIASEEASLEMLFQGTNTSASYRTFSVNLTNSNGTLILPEMRISASDDSLYYEILGSGDLVDGTTVMTIKRSNGTAWSARIKYWELKYLSQLEALNDSLSFHAGNLTGLREFQINNLTRSAENWLLVTNEAVPVRLTLEAPENQSGSAGDYRLNLRVDLAGEESWWLADINSLLSPATSTPADQSFTADTGPYDVLVISHPDFHAGMSRWEDYRESQGYRVKMLTTDQVWDTFFQGCQGAIGIRNAARFAYQQWGAEVLLLVGDSSKDAHGVEQYSMPNFVPHHGYQETVGGVREVVALEEWVVKFDGWSAWPAMLMGRLPVGSVAELDILLDKIECYENLSEIDGCDSDGDWRKQFMFIADDCWKYESMGSCASCVTSEELFQRSQEDAMELAMECITQDLEGIPFFLADTTLSMYAHLEEIDTDVPPCITAMEIQSNIRPLISAIFLDSLSNGYLMASVQSHANRTQMGHEQYFKSGEGSADEDYILNEGKPFFWVLLGCHGNTFAYYAEGSEGGDGLGEKFLFTDNLRGAVASYASDGYEYLSGNSYLAQDMAELMFWKNDPNGDIEIFPNWRLGLLQMVVELRYRDFDSSYRMNLLGDPLTMIDMAPPRIRLWVDRVPMSADDYIPVMDPGDTLILEALIVDENHISQPDLTDPGIGFIPVDSLLAGWVPFHGLGGILDSLVTQTDTLISQLLEPVDTTAALTLNQSRGWYLKTRITFDHNRELLRLSARDAAGKLALFELPVAKTVTFFTEEPAGDTGDNQGLQNGQWVRPRDRMTLRIRVPSSLIGPEEFSLIEDGELNDLVSADWAGGVPDTTIYHMDLDYDWSPGIHTLEVRRGEESYGMIQLQVDDQVRLLAGMIFPNPFRSLVTFHYHLTGAVERGDLSIYTLTGRRIYRQNITQLTEGVDHILSWDGLDGAGDKIANGVYLSRVVFTTLDGEKVVWEDKVVRMR